MNAHARLDYGLGQSEPLSDRARSRPEAID